MAKTKLISIIATIVLMASNQVHSPDVIIQEDDTFSYCEKDEIRKLKESNQENVQSEYEIEQPEELPKNESPKKQTKPKTQTTPQVKHNQPQNSQSVGNKVYIDGFGYVEPAEPPTAILGTSDGDINKIVGEM